VIILERFAYTPLGTFGKFRFGEFEAYTVEQPWNDNKRFHSCIPEGNYSLEWFNSSKHGKTLALKGQGVTLAANNSDPNNRYAILIHPANTMNDIEGCIGLGSSLGYVANKWAVLSSRKTTREFLSFFSKTAKPKLTIQHYTPNLHF